MQACIADRAGSLPYVLTSGSSRAPRWTTSRSLMYRISVADGSRIVFAVCRSASNSRAALSLSTLLSSAEALR